MKYYIIAGEASGDLHGSNLMKGIKAADSEASFRVWGGELMEEQGGDLVRHYKETAVMGFAEVIASIVKISSNISYCKRDLLNYKPDLLILIDYPGFNFRIARFAKRHNIRVFFYISPKVWAWKESRIKYLKRDIDRLFIIFPFEIEYFKKHGVKAIYNGNPLIDSINSSKCHAETESQFRARIGIDDKPIIALLAGSRTMEIKFLMPKMVQLEKEFPEHNFLLAGAPSTTEESYSKYLQGTNIRLLFGETYSILKHSKATVLSSGTASLEAALLGTPQVVCYGGNEISFQIAKMLVKVKYVSLVNLILNEPLVKELLQHDCTPAKIRAELKSLMNPKRRDKIFHKYEKIKEMLGGEGASQRVAHSMINEYNLIRKNERFSIIIKSPIGNLKIVSNNDFLLEVKYTDRPETSVIPANLPKVLTDTKQQLEEYFLNKRESFNLPISTGGTDFQQKVWKELSMIPFGKVKSYGDISRQIGEKEAHRAVGMACKMNPLLIVIPCHRVIGAHNKLTGFNIGIDKKSFLLNHEKAYETGEATLFTEQPENMRPYDEN